jgi:hypothetical protein
MQHPPTLGKATEKFFAQFFPTLESLDARDQCLAENTGKFLPMP